MMTLKRNLKKLFALYTVLVLMGTVFVSTVYAEGDPMTTVNNL